MEATSREEGPVGNEVKGLNVTIPVAMAKSREERERGEREIQNSEVAAELH